MEPEGTVSGTGVPGGPEIVTVLPCTHAVTVPAFSAAAHNCSLCMIAPSLSVERLSIGALGPYTARKADSTPFITG